MWRILLRIWIRRCCTYKREIARRASFESESNITRIHHRVSGVLIVGSRPARSLPNTKNPRRQPQAEAKTTTAVSESKSTIPKAVLVFGVKYSTSSNGVSTTRVIAKTIRYVVRRHLLAHPLAAQRAMATGTAKKRKRSRVLSMSRFTGVFLL